MTMLYLSHMIPEYEVNTSMDSSPLEDNLVQFPSTVVKPKRVSPALARKGMKQEVYPFKKEEQIKAMQRYFLSQMKEATTANKKKQALRNWLWFSLGINIGYRGGDVCQLKWGDVLNPDYFVKTDAYNYVTEEKTGKHRQLIFNEDCKRVISFYLTASRERPDLEDYIFPSQKGGHMENKCYGEILKRAAKEVGIPFNVNTHSLRKTFGYRYYKATGDLATLQRLFNHGDSLVTLRYIGIDAELLQAAYERVNGAILNDEELNSYLD